MIRRNMDLDTFLGSRVCIVSGKGGVGKTTISAVLARAAATSGRRVLLIEVEGKTGLPALFGSRRLGYEPQPLADGVDGRTITAEEALLEFFDDRNLQWVAKRLQNMNLIEVVATAAPGLKDILVLGKVKQLEVRGDYDMIIVDAPAAGHTLTFLGSAGGVQDAVRVGPVLEQADEVQAMLCDHDRTGIVLTTLAEETPVNETIETAEALVGLGIKTNGFVVNGWYPEGHEVDTATIAGYAEEAGTHIPPGEADALSRAALFRALRHRLQVTELQRLEQNLALPHFKLPYVFSADFGPDEINILLDCTLAALSGRAA